MSTKKTAIVIGSGAGGGMMARELQGRYQVTILEKGGAFKPFAVPLKPFADMRGTGLYFDERLIRLLIPNMAIDKAGDMVLVRGYGVGGTTTLATGNAVRYDKDLRALGIDLDAQFEKLYAELPITTDHQKKWTETTRRMYAVFEEMGLDPVVTPKFLDAGRCVGCGHCAIGCPTGAKWDTRALVEEAVQKGATLVTGCSVTDLEIRGGEVTAVQAIQNGRKVRYTADLIVLCAGGLGTPVILENSGIATQKTLFVDPVLCVAGPLEGIGQDRQILMPFISQQDGYILSPYMDYLSFFFNKAWRRPMKGIASMMIKLADEERGSISPAGGLRSADHGSGSAGHGLRSADHGLRSAGHGSRSADHGLRSSISGLGSAVRGIGNAAGSAVRGIGSAAGSAVIDKPLTERDNERLDRAITQCREILTRLGIHQTEQFLGTLNAGHPGGMLPLTAAERDSLHNPSLPGNLYVADATILSKAMGNPPILTIMALAEKIAERL